jgi:hypothetical protein
MNEGGLKRVRRLLTTSTIALALIFCSIAKAQNTQSPTNAKAADSSGIDPHNLAGVWLRASPFQTFSNVDNRQPGLPGRRGPARVYQEAPLTPAGRAAFEKNKPSYGPRAIPPALGNDPMGTCDPLGIPRLLNLEYGSGRFLEIVQTKDRTLELFYMRHAWREIWTDGRKLPKTDDLEPKWDGYAVGHWDGNTFVVDSVGFDPRTWLDKFGYPHTDAMKLQERYRRLDRDTLELTMTITDPEYYSKPWVSDTKIFKTDAACVGGRAKCMASGAEIKEFPAGISVLKHWDEQYYCVPSEEYRFNQRIRNPAAGRPSTQQ